MFRKIALALSAAAMTALPVAAEAHGYYGGYGYGYPSYGYGGYGYPAYGYGNYGYRPYGYSYGYRPSYYGYDRYRCNRNTAAGALIGGVAGALIGRSVARGGHYSYRYGYYRHGDRRAGTLIGGAVGAVAGGAIANSNCY